MWQAQHLVALWTLDAAALDAGRRGSGRWTLRRCAQDTVALWTLDTVAPDAGRRGAGRWTADAVALDAGRRGSGCKVCRAPAKRRGARNGVSCLVEFIDDILHSVIPIRSVSI